MGGLWWMLLVAGVVGKVVTPLVTFTEETRWAYLSKYILLEGRGVWSLRAKLHRPVNETSEEKLFLSFNVYLDLAWNDAIAATDCKTQSGFSKEQRIKVPVNGGWSSPLMGSLNQLKTPHIWYFAVSDCMQSFPQTSKIRLELSLHTRTGSEFSYEDEGLVYLYPSAAVIFAIALSASLFSLWKKFKRTEDMDTRQLCVGVSIGMEFGSLVLQSVHMGVYAYNGAGVGVVDFLGQTLGSLSQLLMMIVLILISAGWTLKFREFPEPEAYVPVVLLTVLLHLLFVAVGKISDDAYYKFSDYESTAGYLFLSVRFFLWIWFLYNSISLLKTVGSKTRDFVLSFSLFSSIYFLSMPCAVFLSWAYPVYQRNMVLAITTCFIQMVAFWLLTELFGDRGTYFQVSTASEGVLPGKIR